MQAEEKRVDTGISKNQVNKSSSNDKEHKFGRAMQGNSRGSHEECGNKPAGMVHQGHPEDQTMRTEEESLDQGQREEVKHGSSKQPEEMKHERVEMENKQHDEIQHDEMKHEQHGMKDEGMKHEG